MTPAKIITIDNYDPGMTVHCPSCNWSGTAGENEETYRDLFDVTCPRCEKMLLVVQWASAEDARASAGRTETAGSLEVGGMPWRLADPFDTQFQDFAGVPAGPGLYLWLLRAEPLAEAPSDQVLYVGQSTNMRNRLHQYSSISYKREDPVLRSLFDRVLAPQLPAETVKSLIVDRLSSGLAQMWIRDQVLFAWAPWEGAGRRKRENELRLHLQPLFNTDNNWTRYATTWHGLHDLTLPIRPIPPS